MPIIKKLDDDTDSDSEITVPIVKKKALFGLNLLDHKLCNYCLFPNAKKYKFVNWISYFDNRDVDLTQLVYNPTWHSFFENILKKSYFDVIENKLTQIVKNNQSIVPYPELLFNSLNIVNLDKIKVVIFGQDPYTRIPDAMGLSFSVPINCPKPQSLINVYANLAKFGHFTKIPNGGNLSIWALQGCLLLNAAFTTIENKSNAHSSLWNDFTQDLIKYINDNCNNIVFLVWGSNAHKLCLNVNPDKHLLITSSHPSPLGYNKTFKGKTYNIDKNKRIDTVYPPFENTDHFGLANIYLKKYNKQEILWDFIL